jgi:uncharacterized membrane protein YidH (DUF202 family)
MKDQPSTNKAARGLLAVCLCGVGFLAFILSVVVFFGWAMKDRKSDPDPTTTQIVICMGVGSLILASSVACFVLARKLLRPVFHPEPQLENGR